MEIAEFWALVPEGLNGDQPEVEMMANHLYPRLQTVHHFRETFEKLDATEKDLIYFLALHGGEIPFDECKRRMSGGDDDAFEALITGLNRRGFIWRDRISESSLRVDLIGIPEPFVRLIELPPYWQGFLGNYLQQLGTNELLAIARHTLDEKPGSRKKRTLVHYLRKRLLDPANLRESLERHSELQLEMFNHILQKNGVCSWKELIDAGLHKKFDHIRADQLRELVEQSGLVFVFKEASSKYQNLLIVPRDMAHIIQHGYKVDRRSLKELSSGVADQPTGGFDVTTGPGNVLDNSNNVLRDLAIVCAYIQRHRIKMLNNGGLGRNDMKKVVPLLSRNKTVKYVNFLARFAIEKRLVIAVGDQWRSSSLLGQWIMQGQRCFRDLYAYALGTSRWNEEFIDGDVQNIEGSKQHLITIPELRKLVLRMLEKVPADKWIDFETFAESMLPQVAIEIPGRFDLMPSDKHNRHMYLIIESVLAETLYWMGIVAIGVPEVKSALELGSRPNEAIAPYDPSRPISPRLIGKGGANFSFRLTDFGRQLFTRPYLDADKLFAGEPLSSLPYAQAGGQLMVQPNLEIVTPPDLGLDKFFNVLQFTDVKNVDVMTVLTLTADSIRAGIDAGVSAEAMVEVLEQTSARELPRTVHQMIEECKSRHGEVDMGLCGGYIHVNDPLRLEELKANKKISPEIKDVFANEILMLNRSADFKKVAKELQRLGLMPAVDSDSLHVTSDGLFQITLKADELYDLLAVLRFCIMMAEEAETPVFEDRVRPLYQRLSAKSQGDFNPRFYSDTIAKTFFGNYEGLLKKKIKSETQKYRKQVTRLMNRAPRARTSGYQGANPASESADILKMIKYAIENESSIKIKYQKTNGDEFVTEIEPESLQGKKVYALQTDDDSHHIYAFERIQRASM